MEWENYHRLNTPVLCLARREDVRPFPIWEIIITQANYEQCYYGVTIDMRQNGEWQDISIHPVLGDRRQSELDYLFYF